MYVFGVTTKKLLCVQLLVVEYIVWVLSKVKLKEEDEGLESLAKIHLCFHLQNHHIFLSGSNILRRSTGDT